MASNSSKRDKKIAKQKKKRNLRKKEIAKAKNQSNIAASYAHYPFYECLVPDELFESGLGTIVITRHVSTDSVAVSAFVVDVHCLGVKDALFKIMKKQNYESDFRVGIIRASMGGMSLKAPESAKKIISGAIEYARELGFSPHPDYKKCVGIFGDIDENDSSEKYEYGKDGKPFYINGPHESPAQSSRIVEQLTRKCGEGNYNHVNIIK